MVNEPMHWQLTVAQLRKILGKAQDDAIVGIEIPAGFRGEEELATLYNLQVPSSVTGPVFKFSLVSKAPIGA
jgi:hypothetical protein